MNRSSAAATSRDSRFARKVKIVCTLGPASRSPERIEALIRAGMDVARLNFSHGDHSFHADLVKTIRETSRKLGTPVGIMQDLQGPKIRLGKLPPEGIELVPGERYLLHPEGEKPKHLVAGITPLPISAEIARPVAADANPGARILFDDGKISTQAREVHPHDGEILIEVQYGGKVTSHKGMNLPGTTLSIPCLTDKDILDLEFGVRMGVDAVALSFVRSAQDIEDVRARIGKLTEHPPLVIAKIERSEAVEDQDAIIDVIDGLLVARGDMAVEIGAERVPTVQKQLIHSCNELGVPIITATQMLESMVASPTPTRAEASDVANAVFDGTDAVMLSAETASGQYPIEAVETMARIIVESERSRDLYSGPKNILPSPGSTVESIEFSASRIADHVGAVGIATITHSGAAAKALAKYRPEKPILAITDQEEVLRKLVFVWGVRGLLIPKIVATDDLFATVEKVMLEAGRARQGDLVVVTAGLPTLRRGTTNTIKVHRIGANHERSLKDGRVVGAPHQD